MRRRLGPDVLLAVLLPLACAAALLLLSPSRALPPSVAPVEAPLSAASVICPGAIVGTGADAVGVTSVADAPKGEVTVGLGGTTAPLALRPGRVAAYVSDGAPTVVSGVGALAPGLVAGRSQGAPLAAVDCAPPQADQWFTGVGAEPTHSSVVELVNPNAGQAIADITVRSPGGELDVPQLRGVSVPGGSTTLLDLGAITPRRGELSLEVRTDRGRLAVHVVDTYDELGAGALVQEWLPSQAEPATTNLMLGLAAGAGERTLVLGNAGDDEVRAAVEIVTPTSTFAPAGVEELVVAPGSSAATSFGDVLEQATAAGATGLLVESTAPLTATLRQVVGGDLSLLAPLPSIGSATAAVVPPGQQRLLLAGPDSGAAGSATVTAYAAGGKELATTQVALAPGVGGDVALPEGTALVRLTPEGATVRAALLVQGAGSAVVPLRELVLTNLVPAVRPGIP